jgi:hypothetical protein
MTPSETAALIAYIDARLGRTSQRNPLQVEAWHEDLARCDYTDARQAARDLTTQPGAFGPSIGDLVAAIRKIRASRLDLALDPVPDADPNSPAAYIRALRNQRHRLANPNRTKELTA